MHKFWIAFCLVVAIIIESWLRPGGLALVYYWSFGFLPWYTQIPVLLVTSALVAFLASRFLGGFVGIPLLALAMAMPLLGVKLGLVDYKLGDAARQIANDPRDVQEVADIFFYLHAALVIVMVITGVMALVAVMRMISRRRNREG